MKLSLEQLNTRFDENYWRKKYINFLSIETQNPDLVQRALEQNTYESINKMFYNKNLRPPIAPEVLIKTIVRKRSSLQPPLGGPAAILSYDPVIAAGTVVGIGNVSAIGFHEFLGEGSLAGSGSVQGSAILSYIGEGSLAGSGSTSGGYSVVYLNTSGSLVGSGSTGANGFIVFSTSGSLVGSGSTAGDFSYLSYLSSGSLDGSGSTAGDFSYLSYLSSGSLNGSGSVDALAYLELLSSGSAFGSGVVVGDGTYDPGSPPAPSFVYQAWEADTGITTGSTDHVISWSGSVGSEIFDLGVGTDEGGTYIANWSGSEKPAILFTGSYTYAFKSVLSSTLSAGFTITYVGQFQSGTYLSDGQDAGVFYVRGDEGYGTRDMFGVAVRRDGNSHLMYMDGYYGQATEGAGNGRDLFDQTLQHYTYTEMSADSTTTFDLRSGISGSESLIFNDVDIDTYDVFDNSDFEEIELVTNQRAFDESALMMLQGFYITTGSLSSTERGELVEYFQTKWFKSFYDRLDTAGLTTGLVELIDGDHVGDFQDQSGNGNHAIESGTVNTIRPRTHGKYVSYSGPGTSDWINSTQTTMDISTATTWTISADGYVPSGVDGMFGFGSGHFNTVDVYSHTAGGGRVYLRVRPDSAASDTTDWVSVPTESRFGVTVRRDGTDIDWWVNGTHQGTIDITGETFAASSAILYMDGNTNSIGTWDEVFNHRGTWNIALSDADCLSLSNEEIDWSDFD